MRTEALADRTTGKPLKQPTRRACISMREACTLRPCRFATSLQCVPCRLWAIIRAHVRRHALHVAVRGVLCRFGYRAINLLRLSRWGAPRLRAARFPSCRLLPFRRHSRALLRRSRSAVCANALRIGVCASVGRARPATLLIVAGFPRPALSIPTGARFARPAYALHPSGGSLRSPPQRKPACAEFAPAGRRGCAYAACTPAPIGRDAYGVA